MTADERRALSAGLPTEQLLVLITCRRLWHETNGGEDAKADPAALVGQLDTWWWFDEHLASAVRHPLAAEFDAVFVAAMRRVLSDTRH